MKRKLTQKEYKEMKEIEKQIKDRMYKNLKIKIRMEKDGKYLEKELTPRMICALFDLNYMLNGVWDTIKLNKMDKELKKFFTIIEHFDDAMHGNLIGEYHSNILKWRKKKKGEYIFGKPHWKDMKPTMRKAHGQGFGKAISQ